MVFSPVSCRGVEILGWGWDNPYVVSFSPLIGTGRAHWIKCLLAFGRLRIAIGGGSGQM